jgi:hypothetical protein
MCPQIFIRHFSEQVRHNSAHADDLKAHYNFLAEEEGEHFFLTVLVTEEQEIPVLKVH